MINIENTFKGYPDIVSLPQLRDMLQIGKNTAYELLANNEIKSIRIGRVYKIPKQNVIDYINKFSVA